MVYPVDIIVANAAATIEIQAAILNTPNEVEPAFTAWLAGPPNVSAFTNDAGYLTSAPVPALAAVLTVSGDAGSNPITNLPDPTNAQDPATKSYVDGAISGATPALSAVLTAGSDAGGKGISNLADPVNPQDAVTLNALTTASSPSAIYDQLSLALSDMPAGETWVAANFAPYNQPYTLQQTLAAGNDANSRNITNLADPVNPQDAVTKAYADSLPVNLAGHNVSELNNDAGYLTSINLSGHNISELTNNVPYLNQLTLSQKSSNTGTTSLYSRFSFAAGSYQATVYCNVTSYSSGSLSATIAYSDETGTTQTVTMPLITTAGSTVTSMTATGAYSAIPIGFKTDGGSLQLTINATGSNQYNYSGWITFMGS